VTEAVATPTLLAPPLAGRLLPPRRRHEPVPRPRLLQRLATAADAPVCVIRAPAGYGKSTLLGQFAAEETRPLAWLSLDERDDDPVVLLFDLAHALGRAGAPDEELLARLSAGEAGVVPLALPRLLALLHERTEPLVLVLDDVHLLGSEGARDVLRALCEQAPADCTVVLAGRTRPPIALARLRAAGRLWELKAADLRMTPGEGAAMLRAAGVDADDREAAIVVQRTEGWPAAIYLASLMLRDDAELGAGSTLGPDEADLTEYFREEVLTGAAPEDAEFLVRTSILDELRPEICDAVLGGEDAAERLRALADADLFVASTEARGEAFRVHGLFRDMLRAELHAGEPDLERELHRRACTVYTEAGDAERAIRHAVDAGELDVAGDLIAAFIGDFVAHGRSETVRRWCSWFTEEQLATHPQAALGRGWAAYESGDAADAAHCAALALGGDVARRLPDGSTLEGMGLALRGALGLQGPEQLAADSAAALEGLAPDSPVRAIPLLILGLAALLADDVADARARLEEAEHRAAGNLPTAYGLVLAHLALAAIEEERWHEAEALMARAAAQQRAAGVEHYASQGLVPAVRALLLARRGDLELAREEADRAALSLALLRVILPALGLETRLVLACAYAKLGDGGRARALLREGLGIADAGPAPLLSRWAARVEAEIERAGMDPAAGPALTTAELRTLRYLPTHLSLREVGERLYITRNTVKTHTISIYRKLGVTSRSEAVARGRELGLLDG
jgi:LuxR family maltose regulon positive regulatory protein